jgi:hypothetical protein
MPAVDLTKRTKFYERELFQYNAERDIFICPQGQELPLWKRSFSEEEFVYRADRHICNACSVKAKCTNSKSGRHLRRSFFQDSLDQAQSYRETEDYKKALRKRQVWVEPLFGEGKQWHQGRRFRLRRLQKVNIEGLIRAAGQNIKRLLKQKVKKYTPDPATALALSVGHSVLNCTLSVISSRFHSKLAFNRTENWHKIQSFRKLLLFCSNYSIH